MILPWVNSGIQLVYPIVPIFYHIASLSYSNICKNYKLNYLETVQNELGTLCCIQYFVDWHETLRI